MGGGGLVLCVSRLCEPFTVAGKPTISAETLPCHFLSNIFIDLYIADCECHDCFLISNTFLFNYTVKYKTITKLYYIHKCTKFKIILHILAINKKTLFRVHSFNTKI